MPCSGEVTGLGDALVIPLDAGERGEVDGEVDGGGVLCFAGNRSPELKAAAGGLGRPRGRRSGVAENRG